MLDAIRLEYRMQVLHFPLEDWPQSFQLARGGERVWFPIHREKRSMNGKPASDNSGYCTRVPLLWLRTTWFWPGWMATGCIHIHASLPSFAEMKR